MRVKFVVLCVVAICVSWSVPSRAQAFSIWVSVPTHVLRSTPIRADAGSTAVIYNSNGIHIGVEVSAGKATRVEWSEPLPGAPVRLSSPGPAGLVEGVIRTPNSTRAVIFAYLVRPGGVASAIAGRPSGKIAGADGAHFNHLTFTVSAADASHTGSVPYRFDSLYTWSGSEYVLGSRRHLPDFAADAYPIPNATFTTPSGDVTLIKLEVASTEEQQETGLMNRMSLDPDSGMIFVWPALVLESFYMKDTYIPLSIAFLGSDGTVQEMQDMSPLTLTLHTPQRPYQYAIEANLGFFKDAGIQVGDRLQLHLGT